MTQNVKKNLETKKPREIIFIKEKSPLYLKDHLNTENLNLSKFQLVFVGPCAYSLWAVMNSTPPMYKEDVNGDAGNTKMNKTQSP